MMALQNPVRVMKLSVPCSLPMVSYHRAGARNVQLQQESKRRTLLTESIKPTITEAPTERCPGNGIAPEPCHQVAENTSVRRDICICIYIHIHMYIYTNVLSHIYIYISTHTHT